MLAQREVVYIDIANDAVESGDYVRESDPSQFQSQKTGRGPLLGLKWWEVRIGFFHLLTIIQNLSTKLACHSSVRIDFWSRFIDNTKKKTANPKQENSCSRINNDLDPCSNTNIKFNSNLWWHLLSGVVLHLSLKENSLPLHWFHLVLGIVHVVY